MMRGVMASIPRPDPMPDTRDGIIDAYISVLSDMIEDRKVLATWQSVKENYLLYHAKAELVMVRDFTKQDVAGRIAELKNCDHDNELRDTSLAILGIVGRAVKENVR